MKASILRKLRSKKKVYFSLLHFSQSQIHKELPQLVDIRFPITSQRICLPQLPFPEIKRLFLPSCRRNFKVDASDILGKLPIKKMFQPQFSSEHVVSYAKKIRSIFQQLVSFSSRTLLSKIRITSCTLIWPVFIQLSYHSKKADKV